ncbi:MAG: DUF2147 domain-containing protein [Polaribacter sp.]|nr:DUF2147 domain-containing protein [Polaribacter sp.]
MKHVVLLLLLVGTLNTIQAQQQTDKIIGIWLNEDKTNNIEIYKFGDTYSAKIVWLSKMESNPNLQPKDKKNPNKDLRNRNILGMDIITGLKFSTNKWVNGKIYTPKKGMYADCEIELQSNGQLKIIVSKSGFTKTQIWTRK